MLRNWTRTKAVDPGRSDGPDAGATSRRAADTIAAVVMIMTFVGLSVGIGWAAYR
jgi:hypothetical protein